MKSNTSKVWIGLIGLLVYSAFVWTLNVQFGLHAAFCYALGLLGGMAWWQNRRTPMLSSEDIDLILGAMDSLGVALTYYEHEWTVGEREIYEQSVTIMEALKTNQQFTRDA